MIEECSPAVSEDRGHMSKVDGPESLAISIRDVRYMYKLMNLKIILLLIHCLVDMPTSQARLSYLVMSERHRIVRVMVSEHRGATLQMQFYIMKCFELYIMFLNIISDLLRLNVQAE